jgi:hypothetical protein
MGRGFLERLSCIDALFNHEFPACSRLVIAANPSTDLNQLSNRQDQCATIHRWPAKSSRVRKKDLPSRMTGEFRAMSSHPASRKRPSPMHPGETIDTRQATFSRIDADERKLTLSVFVHLLVAGRATGLCCPMSAIGLTASIHNVDGPASSCSGDSALCDAASRISRQSPTP